MGFFRREKACAESGRRDGSVGFDRDAVTCRWSRRSPGLGTAACVSRRMRFFHRESGFCHVGWKGWAGFALVGFAFCWDGRRACRKSRRRGASAGFSRRKGYCPPIFVLRVVRCRTGTANSVRADAGEHARFAGRKSHFACGAGSAGAAFWLGSVIHSYYPIASLAPIATCWFISAREGIVIFGLAIESDGGNLPRIGGSGRQRVVPWRSARC